MESTVIRKTPIILPLTEMAYTSSIGEVSINYMNTFANLSTAAKVISGLKIKGMPVSINGRKSTRAEIVRHLLSVKRTRAVAVVYYNLGAVSFEKGLEVYTYKNHKALSLREHMP